MTDQELDYFIKRILIDSIKLDFEIIEKDDVSFVPSLQHRRQIKLMLIDPLRWSKKRIRPIWKTIAYKVAVILLIISLGFSAVMVSSPTARAVFLQWITEWYEIHIVYRYTGEGDSDKIQQYEISELPEGYMEHQRIETTNYISITYQKDNDIRIIYLSCIFMQQGSAIGIGIEGMEVEPVIVNGLTGELYLSSDLEYMDNTITWIDPDNNIQFIINAPFEKADLLHMAESVLLK